MTAENIVKIEKKKKLSSTARDQWDKGRAKKYSL